MSKNFLYAMYEFYTNVCLSNGTSIVKINTQVMLLELSRSINIFSLLSSYTEHK